MRRREENLFAVTSNANLLMYSTYVLFAMLAINLSGCGR